MWDTLKFLNRGVDEYLTMERFWKGHHPEKSFRFDNFFKGDFAFFTFDSNILASYRPVNLIDYEFVIWQI